MSDPRTSGGLISAMYNGASILEKITPSAGTEDEKQEVDVPECTDTQAADSPPDYDIGEVLRTKLENGANNEDNYYNISERKTHYVE